MQTKSQKIPTSTADYFAALPKEDAAKEIKSRIDSFYSEMTRISRWALLRNAYYKYQSAWANKGYIQQGGSMGELSFATFNHYENLCLHILNLCTQQKLAFEPHVLTGDAEGEQQGELVRNILDAYTSDPSIDLHGKLRKATEFGVVMADGFVSTLWDNKIGEDVTVDNSTGEILKSGDVVVKTWSPFDVIYDISIASPEQVDWLVLRDWDNKFNVAAKYAQNDEELQKDILALSQTTLNKETRLLLKDDVGDQVPIYHFFHKSTPALPNGRHLIFLTDSIVLDDLELDYPEIPVYNIASRNLWGSPYGYTRTFSLLQMQDLLDKLVSSVITNQITLATQNILVAKGSNIDWTQLYGGLNLVEYESKLGEAGIPKALQLTSTPGEVFNFINTIVQTMGTLAGINSVLQGNPDLSLKGQVSGAALALMTSNSIQFNQDFAHAYVRLAEQVGTAIVNLIKVKAKTKRNLLSISSNGSKQITFRANQLNKVSKVTVQYGNPLTQTTAGALSIADTLMQQGKISKQEYIDIIVTGSFKTELDAEAAEMILIKEENTRLLAGEIFDCAPYDNHPEHIKKHSIVLSSKSARQTLSIVKAVQNHIESHSKMYHIISQDPVICSSIGLTPLPPPPPMPPPPGNTAVPKPALPIAPQPGQPPAIALPQPPNGVVHP